MVKNLMERISPPKKSVSNLLEVSVTSQEKPLLRDVAFHLKRPHFTTARVSNCVGAGMWLDCCMSENEMLNLEIFSERRGCSSPAKGVFPGLCNAALVATKH